MSTERDLYLAKAEMQRRQQLACAERLARRAVREQREQEAEQGQHEQHEQGGAFGWLRRLAGAR